MTDKKSAKEKIQKLIEKYEFVVNSGKVKKYTEEETKKDFILPLFEILGWNVTDKNEVTAEEHQSSGRVDYGFYLNDRIKFYVEAKPLKADLHKEDYANQAVRYSWNKSVTWAVLTDFENIKVFNAQNILDSLFNKLYLDIKYTEFIERFDQLWLLSKESFQDDLLDKEAEKVGKKLQRISVGEKLFQTLNECRELLTEPLRQWNDITDRDLLDEGVQKLIDRLIFIRVAEDRKIEPATLKQLVRDWENRKDRTIELYESMIIKFRELDYIYNSNLFQPHTFEAWKEHSGKTEKAIEKLYGKSGYYEFDFSVIPADVLGSVYENYLGYRLSKSQKGITLDKDAKKRKEQGIYYTPSFIVDYIVKNALKPILDKCTSVNDLKKIKILDPACGSGSFLIKALELINEKYKEFNYPGNELTKIQILQENIYGVDLDEQAVEIARLNLLLSTLEEKRKLPKLDKNIKNGNSLISGTDEDLKKYFGPNYREKIPFNWEEQFPEVFKQGGFDAIIGNPPWVFTRGESFSESEKIYFNQMLRNLGMVQTEKGRNIQSGKLNLYSLFILKSIILLNQQGSLGFIIPNNILRATNFDLVRKFILDNTNVSEIVDLGAGIFRGVTASSIILILNKESKESKRNEYQVNIISNILDITQKQYKQHTVKQQHFYKNVSFAFNILADFSTTQISNKIKNDSIKLGDLCKYISPGIDGDKDKYVTDKEVDDNYKPLLFGKDIGRYTINFNNNWICYDRKKLNRPRDEKIYLSKKIVLQRVSGGKKPLVASLDDDRYYTFNSINNIILNNPSSYSLYYILGIINSSLINWYYSINYSNQSELTVNISKTYLEKLPIKIAKERNQKLIENLAYNILVFNRELQESPKNSNKWESLKSEIERIDKKIDDEVYELYGLTPEEIVVVEGEK